MAKADIDYELLTVEKLIFTFICNYLNKRRMQLASGNWTRPKDGATGH